MAHSLLFIALTAASLAVYLANGVSACEVLAQTQGGRICGRVLEERLAVFRGVPYAEQPVGERRFQELQPLKPWDGVFNATVQGPVCPQIDRLMGALFKPLGMSEACIHVNVHAPLAALPAEDDNVTCGANLPVLVFIHGGGFESGSGDPDLYGPEYFVDRNVVMITFNYRQNIFGFMSLNTTDVPGNQGLRDIVTLLRWVRDNVHFFGGNPDDVTIMGQSCGSVAAHLISLSPAADGLFNRVILSSGTALPSFFTTSPVYAQYVANLLLTELGINGSDPNAAFHQLTTLPIDTIYKAYDVVQNSTGLLAFAPVKESYFEGVTTIITEDAANLIENGALKNVPFLIGFNSNECPTFEHRIKDLKLVDAANADNSLLLTAKLQYSASNLTKTNLSAVVKKRYFEENVTYDGFIKLCSDSYFAYPALKLAQVRAAQGSADTFLYQFSYEGEFRTVPVGLNLSPFEGVSHVEDLTYIFRTNSILDEYPSLVTPVDDRMKTSWVDTIINFMTCSQPTCGTETQKWPAVSNAGLAYQNISGPGDFVSTSISEYQQEFIEFFDSINAVF